MTPERHSNNIGYRTGLFLGPFAWFGSHWIDDLHWERLLQQTETREERIVSRNIFDKVWTFGAPIRYSQGHESGRSSSSTTEEDMYNQFLQSVSTKAGTDDFPSFLSEAVQHLMDFGVGAKTNPDFPEKDEELQSQEHIQDDTPSNSVAESRKEFSWSKSFHSDANIDPDSSDEKDAKPEKVVATTTTTEHSKHEDGSVETRVTVWKRYANGRETETTKTYSEDTPAGNPAQYQLRSTTERAAPDAKSSTDKPITKNNATKNGWFWN